MPPLRHRPQSRHPQPRLLLEDRPQLNRLLHSKHQLSRLRHKRPPRLPRRQLKHPLRRLPLLNCPAVAADTPDTKPETTTTPRTTSHRWYVPALEWTNRNTNVGMWFFSC